MLLAGGGDGGLIDGDDSAVGVGHETGGVGGGVASVWGVGGIGISQGQTLGGKVLSPCGLNCGLIDGGHGAVGVGDQTTVVGVGVVGIVVEIGEGGTSGVGKSSTGIGKGRGIGEASSVREGGSIGVESIRQSVSLGGKVGSPSRGDRGGLGGGDGTTGVLNQPGGGASHDGKENLQRGLVITLFCSTLIHNVLTKNFMFEDW